MALADTTPTSWTPRATVSPTTPVVRDVAIPRRRVTQRRGIATSLTTGVVVDTVARGSKMSASCQPTPSAQRRRGWTARRANGPHPKRPNKARWSRISALGHLTPSLQTSARPDSTPRSGPLRPRRGPLLLPPSILKTACPQIPHGPHETLTPKIDPRCPDLVSRSFLEVMVPPLLQSIHVDVLALSLIMWNHGCIVFWYICVCICKMYGLG